MDELRRWIDAHVAGRHAVVIGVGNRLRGDDGAGPAVADRLRARGHEGVIDAGTVPENYLGALAAASPEVVVFVDAIAHGGEPGACAVVDAEALPPREGGTHAPTLRLLARCLADGGARCWVLGVQPGPPCWGEVLSPAVADAVEALAAALDAALAREVGRA